MQPAERVLEALDRRGCRPLPTANGWKARCPVHGGEDFDSLSVAEGTDGRVLLTCHSKGCAFSEILHVIGLRVPDAFPPERVIEFQGMRLVTREPDQSDQGEPEDVYDYTDENGALVFQVCRFGDGPGKTFRQRMPDGNGGWQWSVSGIDSKPLYRLPSVLEVEAVFVVEGEKDVDNLVERGVAATTSAQGSGAASYSDWRPLAGKVIVLLPDNDEAGRRHMDEVGRLLTDLEAAEVRLLELPGLSPKGDVSDWLEDGGTVDELRRLADKAPTWQARSETNGSIWRTLGEYLDNPELMQAPEVLVEGMAWSGRITMLAAREKAGKSTLAAFGAAGVTHLGPGAVLWLNLEESPHETVTRFRDFGAHREGVIISEFLSDRVSYLTAMTAEVRPKLIVVDTLVAWGADRVTDWNSAAQVAPVMQGFQNLARQHGCAILILHHGKKSDGKYRDSTAIGAAVDVIIEMTPDERDSNVRRLRAVGRWSVEPRTLRWDGEGYSNLEGELSIHDRVYRYVETHPGCSKRAIRDNVAGKHAIKDQALQRLMGDRRIEDRGDANRSAYFASSVPPVN